MIRSLRNLIALFSNRLKDADRLPSSEKSNGLEYVAGSNDDSRTADIVFVHGLRGHILKTWHKEEKTDKSSWLYWLGDDLKNVAIWSYGYKTAWSNFLGDGKPRFDQASNLIGWLETRRIGDRPLFFVTHSLGGLIVKEMLKSAERFPNSEGVVRQTKGIVFLATPHTGADLADWVGFLCVLLQTSITVQELKQRSASLRDLHEWYTQHARKLGIATKVYYELQTTYKFQVVDAVSANPNIEDVKPFGVEANHITIAKPGKEDFVYQSVKEFITTELERTVNPHQPF